MEGQIHGGVVQGIGWALFEGMIYDEQGQLLTATLMDYALPQSRDVPPITPLLVEVPSELSSLSDLLNRLLEGSLMMLLTLVHQFQQFR